MSQVNKIVDCVYIADEASVKEELLDKLNIGAVVIARAGNVELPGKRKLPTKAFQVLDTEEQDLIHFFNEAIEFLEEHVSKGVNVLVFCVAGISRSVSFVIAYLMKTQQLDYESALAKVQEAHPIAEPNEGFAKQLTIFGNMGYTIKLDFVEYKRYRMEQAVYWAQNPVSLSCEPVVVNTEVASSNPDSSNNQMYSCRMCRTPLFMEEHMIPHSQGTGEFIKNRSLPKKKYQECTSHFIESFGWMGNLEKVEGKLMCPKCSARVGSWHWAGMQCSCGAWVRPAFQVVKSKVDAKRHINFSAMHAKKP